MLIAKLLAAAAIQAAPPTEDFHAWAPTPPMGWNSWDCYGPLVDEATFRRNAEWQARHLLKFGYEYCVCDIRWYVRNERGANYNQEDPIYALDAQGRYVPDPGRFPSSADGKGFRPLADYVHSLGLKFGIHIMRGIPKAAAAKICRVQGETSECCWLGDNLTPDRTDPRAQAYYDAMIAQYADWGVDFIKCDDLSAPKYHTDDVEMLRLAIDRCGRRIVLSTSPGETPLDKARHVAAHANMWRMVNDLWDEWRALDHLTDVAVKWLAVEQVPGAWADCDMIPLGTLCVKGYWGRRKTRLTPDEQHYLMALLSICRSPLMIGSDLPSLDDDPETVRLLTDPLLLAMNQRGRNPRVVSASADAVVIVSDAPDGGTYRATFDRRNHKAAATHE
ncbi:MAG: glycoside hydrolase family 27 protein [Kiritimatiellia bacterium]